jgi:undecaprenyl-phosphate 4-deoxy-4-formamido-L-arabinose transferase
MLLRRFAIGPEAEGVFTLFAIVFFLMGIVLMGLGIMGEYIGRIYQEVRHRPRYVIKEVIDVESQGSPS